MVIQGCSKLGLKFSKLLASCGTLVGGGGPHFARLRNIFPAISANNFGGIRAPIDSKQNRK